MCFFTNRAATAMNCTGGNALRIASVLVSIYEHIEEY